MLSRLKSTNMYLVVFNVTRSGTCIYNPLQITTTEPVVDECSAPVQSLGAGVCAARTISFSELEEIRGIQKCKSETNAVILGMIIPLGIGAAVLGAVWMMRRRKRMRSMRAGMLVPNAENNEENNDERNEQPENNNAGDIHLDNLNPIHPIQIQPQGDAEAIAAVGAVNAHLNRSNSPSFMVAPVDVSVVFPSSSSSSSNSTNSRVFGRSGGVQRQNSASAQTRPATSHSTTSVVSTSPARRNSTSNIFNNAANPNYISPFYNVEVDGDDGEDDEDTDSRRTAMHALPQTSSLAPSDLNTDTHTDRALSVDEDDEDEEEEDEMESEGGSDGSEGSREERDPDDLFAGMAREMGIPLPRTSGRT